MSQPDRPLLLLVAHGERGGSRDDRRLADLCDRVSRLAPELETAWATLTVASTIEDALLRAAHRTVIGVPLLFSDGFVFRQKLAPCFVRSSHHLAPPLILWDDFAPWLERQLLLRLAESGVPDDGDLFRLVIAHGSGASERPAACARDLASRLGPKSAAAFLEQAPFAPETVQALDRPWCAIGLFFGDGRHGREDFGAIVSAAPVPPRVALTIGECPGLADVIAGHARALARKAASG